MDALTRYLDDRSESLSAFALRIGRSPSTLTRALSGDRDPSVGLARDVERGTDGAISASQFLAICIERDSWSQPQRPAALHPNDVDRVGTSGPDAASGGAGPALSQEAAE